MASVIGRLTSSTLLITLVLATLLVLPLWVFALVMLAFITIALVEFFAMVRHRGVLVHQGLSVGLGMFFTCLVVWRTLIAPGRVELTVIGQGTTMLSWAWDIFWPMTIVVIFLRQLARQNTFEALNGIATTIFGLAYIAGLMSYFFYIRTFKNQNGALLVLYLVLVTKMGDAGALMIGKLMGRHTLMARVSPRKTVEGFIGAVLVSGLTGAMAHSLVPRFSDSALQGLVAGLVLGIFGQLGDLAESLLKRDCQVKDSSRLLPGLGGVLDVLDSLLFTAPLFYALLIYG